MVCPLRTAIIMISVLIASIGVWLMLREPEDDKKKLKLDSLADSDSDEEVEVEEEQAKPQLADSVKSFVSYGASFFNPKEYQRPALVIGVLLFHVALMGRGGCVPQGAI